MSIFRDDDSEYGPSREEYFPEIETQPCQPTTTTITLQTTEIVVRKKNMIRRETHRWAQ
jgi:hypothetical protein